MKFDGVKGLRQKINQGNHIARRQVGRYAVKAGRLVRVIDGFGVVLVVVLVVARHDNSDVDDDDYNNNQKSQQKKGDDAPEIRRTSWMFVLASSHLRCHAITKADVTPFFPWWSYVSSQTDPSA